MQNIHLALILAGISLCYGQHKTDIVAVVDSDAEIINIQQSFTFYNSYDIALNELYFTDCFWPDFDAATFDSAILDYQKRQRRFGMRDEASSGKGNKCAQTAN